MDTILEFNTAYHVEWDRANAVVDRIYGLDRDHPASVFDCDDENDRIMLGEAVERGRYAQVTLFGRTVLVPTDIVEDVAALLNVACAHITSLKGGVSTQEQSQ